MKPQTKELSDGIEQFWQTVDAIKCQKYIERLYQKIIELNGKATGY